LQEGISFLATAELPSVIVNVQRGGPGLGNIAASQGDYFQAVKGGGHGDYRVLVYAPYTVQEIWDLTGLAFDRADRYRTPVMILTDAILGQMSEPLKKRRFRIVQYDKSWSFQDRRPQKGPVVIKTLHTGEGQLEALNNRLQQKYNLMAKKETRFEAKYTEDAELIVVAFGTSARIALSVVKRLRDAGYKIGLFRPITLYPFPSEAIHNTAGMGKRFLTLELNLGQMVEDVRLAVGGRSEVFFYGRPGGGLFSPMEIQEVLLKLLL
jgi:2-oxoglutarate ferredoxin oxidoreductase subunit alpha